MSLIPKHPESRIPNPESRCVVSTAFLPLPRLGLTLEVVAGQALPGEGLWIDQPHRLVAAGFLYFAIQGAWNLFGEQWMKPDPTTADSAAV